jgi:paraquat-inducible protein B
MGRRANPTLIGAFVVGAVAMAVAVLMLFGSGLFNGSLSYVMFFNTSVEGLNVGAPVSFRGVPVGSVTRIESKGGIGTIAVYASLDPRTFGDASGAQVQALLKEAIDTRGLRAQLRTQSLVTGQLYVALDFFPNRPAQLLRLDPSVAEIPVVPSTLEQVTLRVEQFLDQVSKLPIPQLLDDAARAMAGIDALVRSPEITRTLEGVRQTLARLDRAVGAMQTDLGTAVGSFKATADSTRAALGEFSQTTARLTGKAETDLDSLHSFLTNSTGMVQEVHKEVAPLAAAVRNTAEASRALLQQARTSLGTLEGTLNGTSPVGARALEALQELRAASRSLRTLTDYLDQHPEAILRGKARAGAE